MWGDVLSFFISETSTCTTVLMLSRLWVLCGFRNNLCREYTGPCMSDRSYCWAMWGFCFGDFGVAQLWRSRELMVFCAFALVMHSLPTAHILHSALVTCSPAYILLTKGIQYCIYVCASVWKSVWKVLCMLASLTVHLSNPVYSRIFAG